MKKFTALFFICACVVFLCSCAGQPREPLQAVPPKENTPAEVTPSATEPKIYKWVSASEDNTINPHDSRTLANYEIVDLIQVGLYDWAPSEDRDTAVLIPAIAEDEPYTEDGYTWLIPLKKDAKWANGETIDANTFIYSWKMGLDPFLSYASGSQIAEQYIAIENALAYYSQEQTDPLSIAWEEVGLRAIDSHTIEVTATMKYTPEQVMRHFAFRALSPVYEPLYEAGMDEGRTRTAYGTSLEYFMGCGAFTLTHWVKASERIFEKNPNFINADLIKLDGIDCRVVTDDSVRLQLFEIGSNDFVYLGTAGIDKYIEAPNLLSYDQKTIQTLEINRSNPNNKILTDPLFRKALYYAIDRQAISDMLYMTPAPFFLSGSGISFEDGTFYRDMAAANDWLPENGGYDPEYALECIDAAMESWGVEHVSLTLVYTGDMEELRKCAEYLQSQIENIFADRVSIRLQAMQKQALLDMMSASRDNDSTDWDLCFSSLGLAAETFEPHKKFARYLSDAANRYTNYNNAFLDENYPLFAQEEYRFDPQKTFELTVAIEKSIILDDVTCIPVYQEKSFALLSERMELAVDRYTPQLGFGVKYMDIRQ